MIALLLAGAFWLAAYLVAGWTGVLVMLLVGLFGELLLFGSYEVQRLHAAKVARRRWQAWNAHDAEVRFRG